MSGKRNVSVCRGHELANALYTSIKLNYPTPVPHAFKHIHLQRHGNKLLLRIRVYALPLFAQTAPQHFVDELNKA